MPKPFLRGFHHAFFWYRLVDDGPAKYRDRF